MVKLFEYIHIDSLMSSEAWPLATCELGPEAGPEDWVSWRSKWNMLDAVRSATEGVETGTETEVRAGQVISEATEGLMIVQSSMETSSASA
jgi:hypothetical protein